MNGASLAAGAVIGLVIGGLGAWVALASRGGAQRSQLRAQADELARARSALDAARAQRDADLVRIAELDAARSELGRQLDEHRSAVEQTIERVSEEVVRRGTERLGALAAEQLVGATTTLTKELDVREERFKREVDPLRALLERYDRSVRELESKREGAYQSVAKHLEVLQASEEGLRHQTQSLVTALRSPSTKGRWGEVQLRRVVELAGMVEHCDFVEQESVGTDDGLQRPDLVVTLPDGAQVVIDAKVPLAAYLEALEATDETERRARLVAHARQLRDHVDALSKKAYWRQFQPTPDFVVCFVPGESLLAAAYEADPTLVEQAMDSRVLLTGPINLIALLKTISLGWRQEALAENAKDIQRLGQQLYERLGTFGGHLDELGAALNRSVGTYNRAVGSLEARVLPTARQFARLGATGASADPLGAPRSVDELPRVLVAPELLVVPRDDADPVHEEGDGISP